jgi:tRNA pseudouridine38-40 synthase
MLEVLEARSRVVAAPTFSPNGLYFLGPLYASGWGLPPEATLDAGGAAYDGPP